MNEDLKQNVDTSSVAFKSGIEAGLNSTQDTKNWQAGNRLGKELKEGVDEKVPIDETPTLSQDSEPLFMGDGSGGIEGNAQDEKDATEE